MPQNLISEKDRETLIKAGHDAGFLVEDLRSLVSADNPLLAELGSDLLSVAVNLRQRLERLAVVSGGD
mgnify:CR=1 FL=1